MTYEEAVKMTNRFPRDKNVPSLLADAIKKAKGIEKDLLGELVEGLILSCDSSEDFELVEKYFD
tara:strand:+ start:5348 stop:5539 length:192 start_codon:yes stop_codon:yes gene_type:complete